jgi:hypothetical protein
LSELVQQNSVRLRVFNSIMSSHLRHCPKHRLKLPCAHCALAAKPATAVAVIEPPVYVSEAIILEQADVVRRKVEAERGRERRRKKREQLDAIKLALKTPIAEIKETERQQRVLDRMRKKMAGGDGQFMTDAEQGKGLLVTGADIEGATRAAARTELLSGATDPEYWPNNDRNHVVPEGTGQRGNGDRSNDEEDTVVKAVNPNLAKGIPVARDRFIVKPGTDLDWGQALQDLFYELFVEIRPEENDSYYVCRLCRAETPSERTCKQHLETVHGDDEEPKHDPRFGNVVAKEVREIRKATKLWTV